MTTRSDYSQTFPSFPFKVFLKPKLHTYRCARVCAVWLSRSESNQPQHHARVLRRHIISKIHVIPLNNKSKLSNTYSNIKTAKHRANSNKAYQR